MPADRSLPCTQTWLSAAHTAGAQYSLQLCPAPWRWRCWAQDVSQQPCLPGPRDAVRAFPSKLVLMVLGVAQWTLKNPHIAPTNPHRLCTMPLDGQKKIRYIKYLTFFVNPGQSGSYRILISSLCAVTPCLVAVWASGINISGFRALPNHLMSPWEMLGLPESAVCMMFTA